jgi:3',5'-nucleoside bisphosphate phosphatase
LVAQHQYPTNQLFLHKKKVMKTCTPSPLLIILLAVFSFSAQSQNRKEISFPDIPGFMTLKCDFHIHTPFSDGDVWPTERVTEAWIEGLDAIAITDHIEHRPNASFISDDLNAPWEVARKQADKYHIILIKGAEITRNMPPGHFNAIFVEDVNALVKENFMDAVEAAINQGAFVFWNHPGWRQGAPDTPYWYPVHRTLLEKGWMHGIEIVNWTWYYPEAHHSALEHGLTMFGNSDIHDPASVSRDLDPNWHRPLTLVFATSRSSNGIREALDAGRTAVWYSNKLFALHQYAQPIVSQSIKVNSPMVILNERQRGTLILQNTSDLELRLRPLNTMVNFPDSFVIPPNRSVAVEISVPGGRFNGLAEVTDATFLVTNVFVAPDSNLQITIPFKIVDVPNLSVQQKDGRFFLGTGDPKGVEVRFDTRQSTSPDSYCSVKQPLKTGSYPLYYKYWINDQPQENLFIQEMAVHKGVGASSALIHNPEPKYGASGALSLTDGLLGTEDFRSGPWLGFYKDLDATGALVSSIVADSVEIRFLLDEDSWIFLPKDVLLEISSDGKTFRRIPLKGTRNNGRIHSWVFKSNGKKIVAFRVIAKHPGLCPPGHAGAGQKAWIFTDEMIFH